MIRLRSLSISNFRGIEEGKIEGFTDLNILVGRNNCGKTTVIEAITRSAMVGGLNVDYLNRTVDQIWNSVRANSDPNLMFRKGSESSLNLTMRLADLRSAVCEDLVFSGVYTGPLSRPRFSHLTEPVTKSVNLDPVLKSTFCTGVTVLRPNDASNFSIEQTHWSRLIADRTDRELTETLNTVFGLNAESLQLLPNNQFMVLFRNHSLPLDLQGDGTRAVMRTLMTLALLRGTLLMIEEPECHQHPGSLERFAAAVCALARSRGVQLIISTHSAECVGSFVKGAKAAGTEAALFHLTLNNGKQDAHRLDQEAIETLTNTGIDIRFLDLYG